MPLFGVGGFTIWLIVIDRWYSLHRAASASAAVRQMDPMPMEAPKMVVAAVLT